MGDAEREAAEWRLAATLATDWSAVRSTWEASGLTPEDLKNPHARTAAATVLKVAGRGGLDDDAVWYATVEELNERGEVGVVEGLANKAGGATPLFFGQDILVVKRALHREQDERLVRECKQALDAGGGIPAELRERLAAAEEVAVEKRRNPFRLLSAGGLLSADMPERQDFVGEAVVFAGGMSAIVGAGGSGKSRIVEQLAVQSVLGLDFGPLKVPKLAAGSWLLLVGNENSPRRLRRDLDGIQRGLDLTPEQRAEAAERVFVQVLDGPDDALSPETVPRIADSVRETDAAVVVVDPLGDVIGGDANADGDVRRALAAVQRAVRQGNPDAAVLLVHHSRDGAQNLKQAYGWDAGAFGKGSKAVKNCCRAMIHVVVRDPEDGEAGVVVTCGKCNDARKFEPFAMTFDGSVYAWDRDFDFQTWRAGLDAAAEGKTLPTVGEVVDGRVKVTTAGVLQTVKAEGWQHFTAATVADALEVSKRTVQRHLDTLVRDGVLAVTKGRNPSEASRYTLTQDTIP